MIKRLELSWSRDRIDVIAAIVGALLGVVISCLNLIFSNAYIITIGPMLIIVCSGYLIFRRKLLDPTADPQASRSLILIINIIFWISLAGSMYSLSTEILHRPLTYFILTALCASMIALQILYSRGRNTIYLILFEILLLSLSVRASAFWVFPTLPGVDPTTLQEFVKDFVNLAHIESTRGWITYLNYPIMPLNATAMKILTAVDYKAAMFLAVGLPLILSTIFVFLIGQRLADTKVGLLAALLLNLSNFHLTYSIQLTATTFGIALFTVIIWLFIRDRGYLRTSFIVLTIWLLLLMIITHTMSAFVMLCFIALFIIGIYLYKFLYGKRVTSERSMVMPGLLAIFGVAMLAYWMYAGYVEGISFFEAVTRGLYYALTEQAGFLQRPAPPSAQYGYLDPILNIAGFVLLYLYGVLGCLLWLSQKHQAKNRVALVVALTLLTAFALSFPVFGIRNIMPYRWFAFIYVILSLVAAVAILKTIYRINSHWLGRIALICIIFVTSFFMITNSRPNMDSPIYATELTLRLLYTNAEMAAGKTVIEIYDGTIITDGFWSTHLKEYMGANNVSSEMLNEERVNSGLVFWMDFMAERPSRISKRNVVLGEAFKQKLEESHNLIYSNNNVKVFLAVSSP